MRYKTHQVDGKAFHRYPQRSDFMEAGSKPTTPHKGGPVEFCPVCGTRRLPPENAKAEMPAAVGRCPSCGFDLALVALLKPPVPAMVAARVPRFAYLMLFVQCGASLLLAWMLVYLGSPLYLILDRFLGLLTVLSAVLIGGFCVWLRIGRAISWARGGLFALGLVTIPIGVCAVAAAVSIAGVRHYCALCLKRIGWSEHYTSCPHCLATFHRYGDCRRTRQQLIAQAWEREPSGDEVSDTCPFCFQSLRQGPKGGGRND